MRGERTESIFASSNGRTFPALQSVAVDGFYRHMSDLGLRYGENFDPFANYRPVPGDLRDTWSCQTRFSPRGRICSAPVLFDGALQVFSAGAATVEGRQARMKLPVGFRRILFLGSPGPSSRVCAKVREFSDDLLEGDISLYNKGGNLACWWKDFGPLASLAAGRSAGPGGTRDSNLSCRLAAVA
jgi:hypothetical protein